LSEVSVIWAAAQTEATQPAIVLLGEGWPPLLDAFRKHLVIGPGDLKLLRIAATPEEAVEALTAPAENDARAGPRG
jgi:predicted Rossmann-fold nucleotide-binding protein